MSHDSRVAAARHAALARRQAGCITDKSLSSSHAVTSSARPFCSCRRAPSSSSSTARNHRHRTSPAKACSGEGCASSTALDDCSDDAAPSLVPIVLTRPLLISPSTSTTPPSPLSTGTTAAPSIAAASTDSELPTSSYVRGRVIGGTVGAVAGLAALSLLAFIVLGRVRRRHSSIPDIVVGGAPAMMQQRRSLSMAGPAALGSRRLSLMSVESLVIARHRTDSPESDDPIHSPSIGNQSGTGQGLLNSDDSHTNLFPLSRSGSDSASHSPDHTRPVPPIPPPFRPTTSGSDESTVNKLPRPASLTGDPYVGHTGALRVRNPDEGDGGAGGASSSAPFATFFGAPRGRLPLRRVPSTVAESPAAATQPQPLFWTSSWGDGEPGGLSVEQTVEPGTPIGGVQDVHFGSSTRQTTSDYFSAAPHAR